jgi:chromate transporter
MNTPADTIVKISDSVSVPRRSELFFSFLGVGLTSFGGVMPFARRMLVEQRHWMTEREFTETLGLGQVLPGPNVVNLSIMIGARFHGPMGAILAFSGLMLAPLAIILMLAVFYGEYGHLPVVQRFFGGTAAATAGLVVAMGATMLAKLPRLPRTLGIAALAFAGSGLLGLPLIGVLAVLAPLSIALAWRAMR